MHISCVQENLAKGLAIVGRAVATRSTLPVLSNVLIETDQSRLKLAATNLEIGITCWVGAMIEQEGSITIPGRLLSDLVSSFAADKVVALQTKGTTLHVTCAGYETNLRGIATDEFPVIPEVANQLSCGIASRELQDALNQVVFAAATDDTRPVLAGILFAFRGDTLTLTAADSFRLAVRTVEVAKPLGQDVDIILPLRTVQELGRVLNDQEEPVEIVVTPNRGQVLFHLNSVDVVSRLIEGTFPNVQQVIPTRSATRVILNTKEFQNANKIASLIARDANNIVRLTVNGSDADRLDGATGATSSVTVGAMADVGDTEGKVDAVVEGENDQLTIAFNGKYLNDVLGALNGSAQVSLELNSPSSPGVIRPIGASNYTHVIMPMHLSRSG
ncbi:MAG: DNA polymerase III subunit beta [Chloroflexota bacterium]